MSKTEVPKSETVPEYPCGNGLKNDSGTEISVPLSFIRNECPGEDSNLHSHYKNHHLKVARLPIPPPGLGKRGGVYACNRLSRLYRVSDSEF